MPATSDGTISQDELNILLNSSEKRNREEVDTEKPIIFNFKHRVSESQNIENQDFSAGVISQDELDKLFSRC